MYYEGEAEEYWGLSKAAILAESLADDSSDTDNLAIDKRLIRAPPSNSKSSFKKKVRDLHLEHQ